MASVSVQELKQQIRSGDFSRVYLLYGTEAYLKRHYLNLLIKKTVDDAFKDFNLHTFNAPSNANDILFAAEALPMMSDKTCIVIKDLNPSDFTDKGKKDFIDLLSDIPETCVIIIAMLNVGTDGKGWKEIISLCEKHGSAVKLDKMSRQDLVKYAMKGAQSRGLTFNYALADYFISLVGDSMTNVQNELEKLCANATDGKITKENINAVTVKTTEVKIFELSKNLVTGNCDKAFSILDSLLKQREEPISILGTIIMAYVDMYRAKVALAGGRRPEEMMKVFNYGKNDFRLRNGAKNASKLTIQMLRQSLDVLASADDKLKSTSLDGRLILEETMVKLFLIANGEKVC